MSHTLTVSCAWDDGCIERWSHNQPGDATEAHDDLARRWKAAGFDHDRDKETRTLTRRDVMRGCVETVRHDDTQETAP